MMHDAQHTMFTSIQDNNNSIVSMLLFALGSLLSWAAPAVTKSPAAPPLIPAVHSYRASSQGSFAIPPNLHVIVDVNFATSTQDDGLTLVPPTLQEFAEMFVADVQELFPKTSATVSLGASSSLDRLTDYVFLTFASDSNFTLADGSPTTEGYDMKVTSTGVVISAGGAKGAFWGTRTLLQGLLLSDGEFPSSVISDQPDWPTRGIMLGENLKAKILQALAASCLQLSFTNSMHSQT